MNSAEVVIAAEQTAFISTPAGEQGAIVLLPFEGEIVVPVPASQTGAMVIPVEQVVSLCCEDGANPTPIFSGAYVQNGEAGAVIAGWATDVHTTTRVRHRLLGDLDWILVDEVFSYSNDHDMTLGGTFSEGDTVEWQGGGRTVAGDFNWDSSHIFDITDGELHPRQE